MTIYYHQTHSPVGILTLQSNDEGITGVWFDQQLTTPIKRGIKSPLHPLLLRCEQQLQQYFQGQRRHFELPLAIIGSPFQQQVWRALTTIPYGQCWHYQQIATLIGNPKACQAVGMANSKNPFSIIIPCHRVIGKNGQLTGYSGGLERKHYLLQLEQQYSQ